MTRTLCISAISVLLLMAAGARAQEAPADSQAVEANAPLAGDKLSVEQARLADRFKRLEQVIGQLAELSAATDPRRSRLLREMIARSREEDINVRFESIVELLETERLSAASNNQNELKQELDELLAVLLKADRDKELASQRERVRKYLKEVSRIIRIQKAVRARTEGGDEFKPLSADQQRVAGDTSKLQSEMVEKESNENGDDQSKPDDQQSSDAKGEEKSESPSDNSSKQGDQPQPGKSSDDQNDEKGDSSKPAKSQQNKSEPGRSKPGDSSDSQQSGENQSPPGQPPQDKQEGEEQQRAEEQQSQAPADRAAERLRRAAEEMEQARQELDQAKRDGATERQQQALRALEQAKAELERILRQLREEELERTLTSLAARCRRMLELQVAVYDGTVRVDRVPKSEQGQEHEIEAARLSRQESEIVLEADKALLLLREEGSSVAFPETLEQMRDDMRQVVQLLAEVNVGEVTQMLEQDIIAALEETIAALEKAIKDLEKKRNQPPGPGRPSRPGERSLVDDLAELKMIRSLQMRINKRTQMYGKMIKGEQAEAQELLEALSDLAKRQERVHRATADLAQGRND